VVVDSLLLLSLAGGVKFALGFGRLSIVEQVVVNLLTSASVTASADQLIVHCEGSSKVLRGHGVAFASTTGRRHHHDLGFPEDVFESSEISFSESESDGFFL